MKKISLIVIMLGLFLGFNQKFEAAESRELTPEEQEGISDPYFFFDENEKALLLPGGLLIQGEGTISDGLRKSAEIHYNSKTDTNSITLDQAKKIIDGEQSQNDNSILNSRGITPDMRVVTLAYGSVASQSFKHNRVGWHAMAAAFQSQSGTGPYLLYISEGDSALVGSISQLLSTLQTGRGYGSVVGAGKGDYYPGIKTMYSYIPRVSNIGQRLIVANR